MDTKNVKYSKRIEEFASMVIIDGELIKSKFGHTLERLAENINNYNDVVVQKNNKIDIYCRRDKLNHLKILFENLDKDILSNIIIHCERCNLCASLLF